MPLKPGDRLGPYEVLSLIGAGGMGEVYRALDPRLPREVAVKVLPAELAQNADRLKRFTLEARAASSLSHPNIVTIHEIGDAEGAPYIVMELVDGETLRTLMQAGRFSSRRLLEIAVQFAGGLGKAHAAGIVHRDLKPENVMVTRDRFVKILDFGLAKLRTGGSSGAGGEDAPNAETAEGSVLGTAAYMSPEQATGSPVDFRSDQFALGVILFEMATGRHPFQREGRGRTLAAIVNGEPEPISALNPALPPAFGAIVERCLAKDPGQRYLSTGELAQELGDVLERLAKEGSTAPTLQVGLIPRTGGRRVRRLAWAALAILAVAGSTLFLPGVRERLALSMRLRPVPADKRVAVLPFRATGGNEEDRALADGLVEFLTARLASLERFQGNLSVEPASNVRQSGVVGSEAAGRALGVTLVVAGSVQRIGGRLVLTVLLEDAAKRRTLRAETVESPEEAAAAVVRMLDLEVGPKEKAALRAWAGGAAEAAVFSARALGWAPYAAGKSALERYDQVPNLERAIESFGKALERDPGYALAHAGMGEAYWRLYRATRRPEYVSLARSHCERALAIDDLLGPAWVTLGMIDAGTGRAEEAIADFRKAIDRDPRSADGHRELGAAYEDLGRTAEAEATYRRAIELRPDSWSGYSYLGYFLVTQGRAAEAEVVYSRALSLAPENAQLWDSLGASRYFQGRLAEAESAFAKSVRLGSRPQAMSNLATLQFYRGAYAEAAGTLEKATRASPRDFRIWRNLAAALHRTPDGRSRSLEAYRRAAELAEEERKVDPRNASTLVQLADCYAMLGEADRARAAAAEGLRTGPVDAGLANVAAGLYEVLGDRSEALRWTAAALKGGLPRKDFESDPTFVELVKDRRYLALADGASPSKAGMPAE